MTTPGFVRVYEPPTVEPHEDIAVDVLADGRRRQVMRAARLPLDMQAGELLGVVPEATETIVEVVAVEGYVVTGFLVRGTADAVVHLTIDGQLVAFADIDVLHRTVRGTLPGPVSCATGAEVLLTLTNAGRGSGDYEAVLYGEVVPSG